MSARKISPAIPVPPDVENDTVSSMKRRTILPPAGQDTALMTKQQWLKKITPDEIQTLAPALYELMRQRWIRSFRLEAVMELEPENKNKILEYLTLGAVIFFGLLVMIFKK